MEKKLFQIGFSLWSYRDIDAQCRNSSITSFMKSINTLVIILHCERNDNYI